MMIVYTFTATIDDNDWLVISEDRVRWDIRAGRLVTATRIDAWVSDEAHPDGHYLPGADWSPLYSGPHDPACSSDTANILQPPRLVSLPYEDMHPFEKPALLQGRDGGQVLILQQPTRENNYELKIQFYDSQPGAYLYKASVTARTIRE
jgi:hypothetical protein